MMRHTFYRTFGNVFKIKSIEQTIKNLSCARTLLSCNSYPIYYNSKLSFCQNVKQCCVVQTVFRSASFNQNERNYRALSTGASEPEKKPSLYQRFKLMYKEYWYVLLPVHVVTSAFWLGGFYYLAVTGVDIATLLEVAGAPDSWVVSIRNSKTGGIVTAYTMYKLATPARYTVTLGGTTLAINYLKTWGWIRPMPSKEQLKVIYEDRKTALKEKMSATTGEIKDEFLKTRNEITQHMKEAKSGFQQSAAETREGLKEGLKEAADEWRHVGKLVKSNVRDIIKPQKEDPNSK